MAAEHSSHKQGEPKAAHNQDESISSGSASTDITFQGGRRGRIASLVFTRICHSIYCKYVLGTCTHKCELLIRIVTSAMR